MNKKLLRQFSVSCRWWWDLWGNGHTVATDPGRNGWRARPAKGGRKGVVLVGRPGVEGCFSADYVPPLVVDGVELAEGYVDVAVYLDSPQYVVEQWKAGHSGDAVYHKVPYVGGWGLEAKRLLEEEQREMAKYYPSCCGNGNDCVCRD